MRLSRAQTWLLGSAAILVSACRLDAVLGHRAADARGTAEDFGCAALEGSWTLEAPVPMSALNSTGDDYEPFVAPDGLTLYFSSLLDSQWHPLQATRASADALFTDPRANPWVPHRGDETRFSLSQDGLEAFLSAVWPGSQSADLWVATRAAPTDPWGTFTSLTGLGTAEAEYDPLLSRDGLQLYFARASGSASRLKIARRPSVSASFLAAEAVPGFEDSADDDNPAVSPNQRLLIFGSERPGGMGGKDLWYATRPDASAPFADMRPLPVVNTPAGEGEPFLYGCELYFTSDAPGTIGLHDLYRAHIIPAP